MSFAEPVVLCLVYPRGPFIVCMPLLTCGIVLRVPRGYRSSTPGSNMAALARTANLAPAGDLQSGIGPGNWPVVTYHTSMQMQGVQGAAQMQGGPQAGPGLPGAGGLGYY